MKRSSSQITPGSAPKRRKTRKSKSKGTPEMYSSGQVFPDVLDTTLRYNSNMTRVNPSAATTYYSFILNGMFDFDFDNILGNKQPLYFDSMFTSDGPYRSYNVGTWETTITLVNDSVDPILIYWAQATSVGEVDTLIEVQNRPNVRELILTQKDGDKNSGTIVAKGSMAEVWGTKRVNPENAVGTSAANPVAATFGTLYFYNPGGVIATPVNVWVKIRHDFHFTAQTADAIIS
jgi:hypothetical protein